MVNNSKSNEYPSTEIFIGSIICGMAIAELGGMPLVGYGLTAVGGISTVVDIVRSYNPYRNLLESIKLQDDKIPRYLGRKETSYGYILIFSLPIGLSTDDFEKKKLAIEQNLNRRIEISYHDHKVFIKVYEKELIEAPPYKFIKTKKPLEFVIGFKYGGEIVTMDLAKITHLLIAGETGSGKSTLLRAILTNIILSDNNIKLHLIDLKHGAELGMFSKCKNIESFSRNVDEAEEVFKVLTDEVDRRFDMFYESNVVDIKEYNSLKRRRKLGYRIVIVDEFADLQNKKNSIALMQELARKSRAAGIHLIISTQRPSAKILEGDTKANFPATIGLKTRNDVNSRIIIGENGLEKLRGAGHGIFQFSDNIEFQSMNLEPKQARSLIKHTYRKEPKLEKPKEEKIVEENKEIKDFGFLEVIK